MTTRRGFASQLQQRPAPAKKAPVPAAARSSSAPQQQAEATPDAAQEQLPRYLQTRLAGMGIGAGTPPSRRPSRFTSDGVAARWRLRRRDPDAGPQLRIAPAEGALEGEAQRIAEQVGMAEGASSPIHLSSASTASAAGDAGIRGGSRARRLAAQIARGGGGRPLDPRLRAPLEAALGRDLGGVRLHTEGEAAGSARGLGARAYTVGRHVVFAPGRFDPDSRAGRRLLAHELAHVAQQGAAPVPGQPPAATAEGAPLLVQRDPETETEAPGTTIYDEMLEDAVAEMVELSESASTNEDRVWALRVIIILNWSGPASFTSEDEVDDFVVEAQITAESEQDTLDQVGEAAIAFTQAFPLTWGELVYDALYVEVDLESLATEVNDARDEIATLGETTAEELADEGLPMSFADAMAGKAFKLLWTHAALDRDHVVRDWAQHGKDYVIAGFPYFFYHTWNEMADNAAQAVEEGEIVVNYTDYRAFIEAKRGGVDTLASRLAGISAVDALNDFDDGVVALQNMSFVQALGSTLVSVLGALALWGFVQASFDPYLADADAIIAGKSGDERLELAMTWAYNNGYFGAAGEQIWNAIKENGWQIMAMVAGFIAVQFVPYLNVAVDVVVILHSGVDAVAAIASLGDAFERAKKAASLHSLQRESAKLAASLTGDGLRVLMDVLAIVGAGGGLKARVGRIKAANPALSSEEALQAAMKEVAATEPAAAKAADAAKFLSKHGDTAAARTALTEAAGDTEKAALVMRAWDGEALSAAEIATVRLTSKAGGHVWDALQAMKARGLDTKPVHTMLNYTGASTGVRGAYGEALAKVFRAVPVQPSEVPALMEYVAVGKDVGKLIADAKRLGKLPPLPAPSEGVGTGGFDVVGRMPREGPRTVLSQEPGAPSCGPVSCGMVIDTAGQPVDLAKLVAETGPRGTTADVLESLLARNKVVNQHALKQTPADLAAATSGGNPAIVVVRHPNELHWVVVDGITTRNGRQVVAIRDPHGMQYYELLDVFKQRFTGEAVYMKHTY